MNRLQGSPARPGVGRRRAAVVLALILAVVGASADSDAAGYAVQARNFEFVAPGGGSTLTVAVGDQVTWIASGDPHTVTSGVPGAIDDRFDDRPASAGFLLDGSTFTAAFPTSGTYPYFCEVHFETMRGTVIVIAASTPAPTKAPTPEPTRPPTAPPGTPPPSTPVTTATPGAIPSDSSRPSSMSPATELPTPTADPATGATDSAGPSGEPAPPPTGAASADAAPLVIGGVLVAILLGGILLARRRARGRSV